MVRFLKVVHQFFCVVEDLDLSSLIKIEYLPTSKSKQGKQMSPQAHKKREPNI